MKKHFYTFLLSSLLCTSGFAQTVLFKTTTERPYPYRIPAITQATNGELIAVSDYRPCLRDIGFGRVDLVMRTSNDNGKTWTPEQVIIEGTGKGNEAGYGDACLIADAKKQEMLLMCASGDISYFDSSLEHPQRIMALHATYNKKTNTWEWQKPKDLTKHFYQDLFKNNIPSMFMSSGKICQSRTVKVGQYYRLYAAMCTRKGNFVVYSDNFGHSWNVLGSAIESCAPKGDEVKCEELPDGSILLSSRKNHGRYFNVFHFNNIKQATGKWDMVIDSETAEGGIANTGTPCNGEVLIVKVKNNETKQKSYLLLQSIPAGPGRKDVSIYYKDLGVLMKNKKHSITSNEIASHWNGVYQVSKLNSAYSTMCLQKNKQIAFFYEEAPKDYHEMTYLSLSIKQITNNKYSIIE